MSAEKLHGHAVRTLVFCTGLWGVSFPVMKALSLEQHKLLPEAGSWFETSLGVMYRFGAAGLVLLLFNVSRLKTISCREVEQGVALAFFGVAGILFQMDGLAYTLASTSAFLTQGYCVFIPLWGLLRHRRRPSLKIFLSTLFVIVGVAVLANLSFHSFKLGRGELETLLASLLFTGQILLLENPRYAANRAGNFSTVMFLTMAVLCLPLVWATAPDAAACGRAYASPMAGALLAVLVVFCTVFAYTLMNRWQRHVTATEAGLIYCLEPVVASVLALFLPGWLSRWSGLDYDNEQLTLRLLFGGGLILLANVLLQSRWLEAKRIKALKD
jgi:drug/metabolite transporter (DMT)-like permease